MWFKTLVLVVFAIFLRQGEAIKCHVCSSATDSKCGDPIDSSVGLSECTPSVFTEGTNFLKGVADTVSGLLGKAGIDTNFAVPDANAAFACVKAVRQDGEKKVVIRSCSVPKNDKFDFCTQLKAEGPITFCDTCDKDGCNSASGVTASVLSLCLAVLATWLASIRQ